MPSRAKAHAYRKGGSPNVKGANDQLRIGLNANDGGLKIAKVKGGAEAVTTIAIATMSTCSSLVTLRGDERFCTGIEQISRQNFKRKWMHKGRCRTQPKSDFIEATKTIKDTTDKKRLNCECFAFFCVTLVNI